MCHHVPQPMNNVGGLPSTTPPPPHKRGHPPLGGYLHFPRYQGKPRQTHPPIPLQNPPPLPSLPGVSGIGVSRSRIRQLPAEVKGKWGEMGNWWHNGGKWGMVGNFQKYVVGNV